MRPDTKTKCMGILALCIDKGIDFEYSEPRIYLRKQKEVFPPELAWSKTIYISITDSDEDYLSIDDAIDFLTKL